VIRCDAPTAQPSAAQTMMMAASGGIVAREGAPAPH